jgi:tellurium resistance protein TerZ
MLSPGAPPVGWRPTDARPGPGALTDREADVGVSLAKGQRVSLDKSGGGGLTEVTMGLGWDVARPKGFLKKMLAPKTIDLDASCLLFDAGGELVDQVWFQQLDSKDGSVHHTGDNLTGEGEGDDESIEVDLTRVPARVQTLVFVVNSFTGQDFTQIENAFCRLVDRATGQEVARYELSSQGPHTAQVMTKVFRPSGTGGSWTMEAIGHNGDGRTFHDLLPIIVPHL